jgi:hypothetical protein
MPPWCSGWRRSSQNVSEAKRETTYCAKSLSRAVAKPKQFYDPWYQCRRMRDLSTSAERLWFSTYDSSCRNRRVNPLRSIRALSQLPHPPLKLQSVHLVDLESRREKPPAAPSTTRCLSSRNTRVTLRDHQQSFRSPRRHLLRKTHPDQRGEIISLAVLPCAHPDTAESSAHQCRFRW